MAKRSELEAQMAALAEQLKTVEDDDDYEVWVKNDKGHETKVPSKRAAGWLKENFGISLTDLPEATEETETTEETTEKKVPAGGFFGTRKS
jgi:predicted 3-demethylubiquinone-9 3-methyltransferase (glyoxalase superfamily)